MTCHDHLIKDFETIVESQKMGPDETIKITIPDERIIILDVILHFAGKLYFWSDVSNPARPFKISKKWSDCLTNEFGKQTKLEKINGSHSPTSTSMDPKKQVDNQIYFSTVIVQPLIELIIELFPQAQFLKKELLHNIDKWSIISPVLEDGIEVNTEISSAPGVYIVSECDSNSFNSSIRRKSK
jgi:hypothetical protein